MLRIINSPGITVDYFTTIQNRPFRPLTEMERPPDPVARALAQPHIVQSICDHLPNPSLANAARVDRRFFVFATEAKWRHAPLRMFRLRIPPSRRQLYASKVRVLLYERQAPRQDDALFRKFEFDGLRDLTIRSEVEIDQAAMRIRRYLAPTLEGLHFIQCFITPELLRACERHCRQLRVLDILPESTYGMDSDSLTALIAANPLIEELRLQIWPERVRFLMKSDLYVQCARQPRLRILTFAREEGFIPVSLQMIQEKVDGPFPALEHLIASVPSSALPLFGQWFDKITVMTLKIVDADVSFVGPMSSMTNLKRVGIEFPSDTIFSKTELMSLRSLSKLEELSFSTDTSTDDVLAEFPLTVDEFKNWIKLFPGMKKFGMAVSVEGGPKYDQAMPAVARSWPQLQKLAWPAGINFSELPLELSAPPLFPNLRSVLADFATADPLSQRFPL